MTSLELLAKISWLCCFPCRFYLNYDILRPVRRIALMRDAPVDIDVNDDDPKEVPIFFCVVVLSASCTKCSKSFDLNIYLSMVIIDPVMWVLVQTVPAPGHRHSEHGTFMFDVLIFFGTLTQLRAACSVRLIRY